MGIIREESRTAYRDQVSKREADRQVARQHAMNALRANLDQIIDDLANDANQRVVSAGDTSACFARLSDEFKPIVGNEEAIQMVLDAMRAREPLVRAVKIDSTSSILSHDDRPVLLTVMFSRPLT